MGQKSASGDTSGNIITYYDDKVSPAPSSATNTADITDAQWQDSIANPGKYRVVSGVFSQVTVWPIPSTLAQQQQANITMLQTAYQTAINAPVMFKNAGAVTSTYAFGSTLTHGGTNAQSLLTQILSAGSTAWIAGVWFDIAGVAQTMTFADLQGIALAVEAMETPDEQHLMTKIAAVQAQTSLPYVEVIW